MRIRTSLAAGAVTVLLAGLACSIDDNSAEVSVVVLSASPVVVRGDKVTLQAYALRAGTDTLRNVSFVWTTSDPNVATIVGGDSGRAELTGVNPNTVEVRANAVAFEQSAVGTFSMRVSNFLEIDSVKPDSVQWGDKATVYGVGVRNIVVSLPGSPLVADTFSFQGSPEGLGQMSFWVPPPARSARLFALGLGAFLNAPDSTFVDTLDLYELVAPNTVNDTSPAVISLDGTLPFPPLPVLFFNPALSFEPLPRDPDPFSTRRFDWYRLTRADTMQPFSVILKPQSLIDSTGLFIVVSDSLVWNPLGGHAPGNFAPGTAAATWFITSENFYVCPLGGFSPDMLRSDSLILQFKRRTGYGPGRGIHLLAFYTQFQPYALTALTAFSPTDARIGQDRFEENDICTFADANQLVPATHIEVATSGPQQFVPFQDSTLTIDTPHEVDFYRFRVTAAVSESVMIKVRSRPFGTGPIVFDRSDVDLYVLNSTFGQVGSVSSIGSRDSMRLFLAPGDYYLVVADFQGEVTRYSLCINVRIPCIPQTSAVEAAFAVTAGPARDRARDDGRTKTGWVRTRDWAVPPSAVAGKLRIRRP